MIRRARLSLKPNVKPGGRGPGPSPGTTPGSGGNATEPNRASQASPGPNHETPEKDKAVECSEVPETREENSVPDLADRGDSMILEKKGTDLCNNAPPAAAEVQLCSTSTPLQRRKRIATLPNLAKPRVSIPSTVTTLPLKASQGDIPIAVPSTGVAETATPEKVKLESSFKIPTPCGISQPSLPEKRTPVPQVPQFTPFKKPVLKQPEVSPVKAVEPQSKDDLCPLKERPSQGSSISEEYLKKTKPSPVKKLVGNLEKERLKRAKKLRELLRDELRKERRASKGKYSSIDLSSEVDHSKMTMRDFIHYIPENNPMTSSLFDKTTGDKSPTAESQSAVPEKKTISMEDEDDLDEEEDEGPLMVPRVKVAEDGSIIIDEESLTVEVSRAKGPIVENDDPIFERGSMTTYSSFRKSKQSKPWSDKETDMFFLAISMVGTDFSMISHLFPHRERFEIKNKFKREERKNGWRIDKAFREKKAFDLEFFAKLLEKALMKEPKPPKTPKPRKAKGEQGNKTRKPRKKRKDEASAEQHSNLGDQESEAVDASTAEKENEESQTENVPTSLPGKKKRARKKKKDAESGELEDLSEGPNKKLPAKEGKSRKKKKGKSLDLSADPEVVDLEEMETAEGEKIINVESIRAKKKKRRRKKKPISEDSNTECHSDTDLLHKAGENDSETKEPSVTLDDSVESCDQSVQKSTEDNVGALPAESLSGDDVDYGSLEPFEDDDDHVDDELLSKQENTLVSNEHDSAVLLASDLSLFDHSSISVSDTPAETSPVESHQEATDSKVTISTIEKSQECDNQENAGARTQEPSTSEDGLIQPPTKSSPLVKGRVHRPKPNLPKVSTRRGEQEKGGDMPDGKIEATTEDITKTFQCPDDDQLSPKIIPMSNSKNTPSNEGSVEQEESTTKAQESTSAPASPIKQSSQGKGRLQKPKPNLLTISARRRKPEKNEDIQKTGMEDRAENPNSSENDKSSSRKEEDASENEEGSVEMSQESSTSLLGSTQAHIKPTPVVRFQRAKPNLTKASARTEKLEGSDIQAEGITLSTEETVEIDQGPEGGMSSPKNISMNISLISQEQKSSEDQENSCDKMQESSASQDTSLQPSFRPSPPEKDRFQRQKPNLVKSSTRTGKQDEREDIQEARNDAVIEKTIHQGLQKDTPAPRNVERAVCKHEDSASVHSGSMDNTSQEPSEQSLIKDQYAGVEGKDADIVTLEGSVSQKECTPSPVMSSPSLRGRLHRPQPNILSLSVRKGKKEVKADTQSSEAANEDTTKTTDYPKEEPSATGKPQGHMLAVFSTEESSTRGIASPVSCFSPSSCPEKPKPSPTINAEADGNQRHAETDEPVKNSELVQKSTSEVQQELPSVIAVPQSRSRFQKPKPNLRKTSVRKGKEIDDTQSEGNKAAADNLAKKPQDKKEETSSSEKLQLQDKESEIPSVDEENVPPCIQSLSAGSTFPLTVAPDSVSEEIEAKGTNNNCQQSRKQEPLKPAVLSRGIFQKPKPNIGQATAKKEVISSQDGSSDINSRAASDQSMEHLESNLPADSGVKEQSGLISREAGKEGPLFPSEPEPSSNTTVQEVPLTKEAESVNVDALASAVVVKEKDHSKSIPAAHNQELEHDKEEPAQEPLKPAVSLKGRYQRPKPNLNRAVAHKDPSVCLKNTSCETAEEQQNASSAPKAEMIVRPELPEKLSMLVEYSEASQLGSEDVQNNAKPDLKQEDMLKQQSVDADIKSSPSVQPSLLRGRFQRPKPNLLRAVAKKAACPVVKPGDDEKMTYFLKTGDAKINSGTEAKSSDSDSVVQLSVEGHQSTGVSPLDLSWNRAGDEDITPAADTTLTEASASLNTESKSNPAIKPAPLRRGKTLRLKPNLVNVSCRRDNQAGHQTKATNDNVTDSPKLDADGVTECVPLKTASHVTGVLEKPTTHKRKAADKSSIVLSPKKKRPSEIADTQSSLSERENDGDSLDTEGQENTTATQTRFERKVMNSVPECPPVQPKGSEQSSGLEKGKNTQHNKSNGSKIKVVKPVSMKGTALVKLRASRWEEQDDDDEEEELDVKDESFNLSPDKVNKAPVFVPFGLRSPKCGPSEIEETVEELEIPVDDLDSHTTSETQNNDPVFEERENSPPEMSDHLLSEATDSEAVPDNEDCSDGSTEAAMTLISMGNPAFQSRNNEESPNLQEGLSSSSETQSDLQHLDPMGSLPLSSEMDTIHADFPSGEILEAHATTAEVVDPLLHTLEKNNGDPPQMQPAAESLDGSVSPTQSGVIFLECLSSQDPDLSNLGKSASRSDATCEVQFEQSEEHSEDVLQHSIVPDSDVSGGNECPAEEATFILTLVEIPLNSQCPYSCDSLTSGEPLPAPVLISSGSSQPITLTQSSSESVEVLVPSEQRSTSDEESNSSWSSSSAPRKRTASRQDDESHPVKKALLMCDTPEELSEDSGTEALNSLEINTTSTQKLTPSEVMFANVTESSQDSQLSEDALSGMETLPEESTHSESLDSLPPIEAGDAKSQDELSNPPSASKPPLKRPGRKPLGFLSLVCKSKKTKVNEPSNSKKCVLKPNVCTKPPSTEIQSQDSTASGVSDSQAATPKTPGANEVTSEEEETTVSQYFFSDIFMPVDDE
ncbi:transcription factor TFIIIB component B'' homolog isoform X2 [Xenopus laevis]|uniref:Transcription factor TFIIIB component B'' homolog isoform X2 n=1 Tax=Xenopus laevis TaxID=8355 RepID=A0A8J0VBK1_XENLA|nr:transcription factor TFIIIB component B'' homolog isoform X2 [Xenopus laevis]